MAEMFFPFNSVIVDGVPDRAANAESLAAYLAAFFSNGVIMKKPQALSVTTHKTTLVKVASGAACINGKIFSRDAGISHTIEKANPAMDRIDRVVLRLNENERLMELATLTGTPASDPTPPDLTRNAAIYELCLAEVFVPAGATSSADYIIKDTRADEDLCGYAQIPPHTHDIDSISGFKTLWDDGEWSSGDKTIAGSEDYKMFLIVMHDQGTVIPVYKHTDNGGIFIRGSNGYQSETVTDFEYYFGATLKDDVWTLVGCSYMYHESGGIHGKRVPCSVKEVIGVY